MSEEPALFPVQKISVRAPTFRSQSARLICQNCHKDIQTKTDKNPSVIAWLSATVIALCGCFCGCCLIPLCTDSCMDTDHSCPECGAHLGAYRAF
ncbi:Lipopolysaccharide-induced tumor necrosis factor-alpha factor [Orchesella cincta]|uniref:Lipopolysaccharide-induced tumor necrosis factor-alpha factor n=1 Tax=Orchesella cincta TaxID=48709 RepID=A0A1D2MH30_ORCCI|nr:Lipopolysaccharide-induced tumor necrosis factor-alpha factor [Orchesella cincta]